MTQLYKGFYLKLSQLVQAKYYIVEQTYKPPTIPNNSENVTSTPNHSDNLTKS